MVPSLFTNRSHIWTSVALFPLLLAASAGYAQTPFWYALYGFGVQGIRDMDSRDSLRCLVVLDSTVFVISKIIKTTDGGVTWRTALRRNNPDGYIGRLTSISWPTDSLAIATADSGRLLRSTDGGETWDDRRLFDSNSTPFARMIDSVHGFVYLDFVPDPATYATDDGGLTWQALEVPDPVGYDVSRWVWSRTPAPVRISPSRFLCVKGGRGNFRESRILVTSDRGRRWDTVRTAFPGWEAYFPWAFSMRFADSLHGWAAVRIGNPDSLPDWRWLVSRTTDGGFTWNVVFSDTVRNRHVNPSILWAGGLSGVLLGSPAFVLRSVDGGASWSYDSCQSSAQATPTYSPLHPTGEWPVFGVNGFAANAILAYGAPPAATGVDPPTIGHPGLPHDAGVRIVALRVDDFLLHLRFVSRASASVSIRVFDVLGTLRYTGHVDAESGSVRALDIDVGELPTGLYGVRLVGDGGGDAEMFRLLRR